MQDWYDRIQRYSNRHYIESVIKKYPIELYLPENISFDGVIETQGLIRLEGKFKGRIHCPAVILAPGAVVTAEIESQWILIEGHFRGIARVSFLYLAHQGRCDGDVRTRSLYVEEGAIMKARVFIEEKETSERKSDEASLPVPGTTRER
ncbi:MAG: polymer-forming cytoskeletal protein [Candidatus Atribacteria bacterium]|nr:polymer-forming cytoskeletal protein [Candidatus Atribacteria bacterium]